MVPGRRGGDGAAGLTGGPGGWLGEGSARAGYIEDTIALRVRLEVLVGLCAGEGHVFPVGGLRSGGYIVVEAGRDVSQG